jgi:hypothetical protein
MSTITRPTLGRQDRAHATGRAPEAAPVSDDVATRDPLLLNVPAAAGFAGITERAMRYLFTQRAFPVVALGTRLYVRRSDLLSYFDQQTRPARARSEW